MCSLLVLQTEKGTYRSTWTFNRKKTLKETATLDLVGPFWPAWIGLDHSDLDPKMFSDPDAISDPT